MHRIPSAHVAHARRIGLVLLSGAALWSMTACGRAIPTAPSAPAFAAGSTDLKSGALSMDVSQWTFQFSPNGDPALVPSGTGWQFTFPTVDGVHYLTTAQRPSPSAHRIVASIAVETTGTPVFDFHTDPDNTCDTPATVRLFFQRSGDDLSGDGKFAYYRWWSNPMAYTLAAGSTTLSGDLDDPAQWTSVFGDRASDGFEKEFRAAEVHMGSIGFTFGGGCFFGHGVFVTGGTATFKASSFAVQ